jgi:hypothetical protein
MGTLKALLRNIEKHPLLTAIISGPVVMLVSWIARGISQAVIGAMPEVSPDVVQAVEPARGRFIETLQTLWTLITTPPSDIHSAGILVGIWAALVGAAAGVVKCVAWLVRKFPKQLKERKPGDLGAKETPRSEQTIIQSSTGNNSPNITGDKNTVNNITVNGGGNINIQKLFVCNVPDGTLPDNLQKIIRELHTADWSKSQAEIAAATGDHEKAIRLFSEYLVQKQDIRAYIERGNVYGSKGDFPRAIADYTEAIKLDQNDTAAKAMAYNNRGVEYSRLNQNDRALLDYKKALEIDPSNDLARNNLEIVKKAQETDGSACGEQISGSVNSDPRRQ